jgi:hypothetical protein
VLHGYCVRRAADPLPAGELSGVAGGAVLRLEEAGLALWYSSFPAPVGPTLEHLRQHDAVIRSALRSATPLPLRFGARFTSEAEAGRSLVARADEFTQTLDRLANRVEMGIRVSRRPGAPRSENPMGEGSGPPRDSPAGPGGRPETHPVRTGREYLEARRRELNAAAARRAEAGELLDRVEAALADLELPVHREMLPQEGVEGLVAHLVHRGQIGLYRQRVLRLREELPELELVPTGPWAPYSFV